MFALLLMLLMAIAHQPGLIGASFRAVFSRLDRTYADAARDLYTNILLLIFRLGTLAMALQTLFFGAGTFSILTFLIIVAGLGVLQLLKWLAMQSIAKIFLSVRALEEPLSFLASLQLLTSIVVYPVTLLLIDYNWLWVCAVLLAAVYVAYLVLLLIRMIRIFMTKPISILYIALYIMTLEIVPFVGVCLAVQYLMSPIN